MSRSGVWTLVAACTLLMIRNAVVRAEDLTDFAAFQRCFGPSPDAACRIAFDCTADGTIDLGDYATFHERFTDQRAPPCGMVPIPAGQFLMGDHHDDMSDALPVHAVYLDSFFMDVHEVTNLEYVDGLNWALDQGLIVVFLGEVRGNARGYCDTTISSSYSRITWNGSTFGVTPGKEDHPMVKVSWYGAAAFANWRSVGQGRTPCYEVINWVCNFEADGFRLPTEAEWEYAARGGEHDPYYRYPWGDAIDGSMANYADSGDPYETGPYPWTTPVGYYDGNQTPPGSDMANGYGLYDMGGNAREWCNDWRGPYSHCDPPPCVNPHGPATGTGPRPPRILRGGKWNYWESYVRCAHRVWRLPSIQGSDDGFRLVLAVE